MINPILIATQGRISKTSCRTLSLATIGRIRCIQVVIIKDGETTYKEVEYKTPGGGGYGEVAYQQLTNLQKRLKRIKKDDEEILLFIKIFLECQ